MPGKAPTAENQRIAKLLRLACDHGATEGEKLAAIGRLSAFVAAHDLDWDEAFAGNPDLTREQLQQVYQAGVEAGVQAERAASANGATDWRPAGQPRTDEVGQPRAGAEAILEAARQAIEDGQLDGWWRDFAQDTHTRYRRWGSLTFVSRNSGPAWSGCAMPSPIRVTCKEA